LLTRGGAASRHYQHPGVPDVEFVIGDDGALQKVISDGAPIVPQRLEDVLERDPPAVRVRDLVLTVPQDATLRDILKGRNYSSLPMVIRQDDGSVHGLVSERELIQGILNKNGYADTERPLEVSR
jgi:glycine betaine/proline transport system ATP-binding protein